MKIGEAFTRLKTICISEHARPVVFSCAREILQYYPGISIERTSSLPADPEMGVLVIASGPEDPPMEITTKEKEYVYFRMTEKASGLIYASRQNLLFSFICRILEQLQREDISYVHEGRIFPPSFDWLRVSFDYFLTQEGRIQRSLDRESYVRELSRQGFTHMEINGLASPMGLETGPKGEIYPMFYTYCPALDQFVYSSLNKGLYPYYYLSANLEYMRQNALLARRFGLVPGLLCFEPRSVPEEFFTRYPMLRGGRVDHPFRSFKPRYTMTITHPLVQQHYRDMLQKIMKEVPDLGYITIWSNDSGAGFEHTKSLYVGRNGGPYLIREWKDDKEIARTAGKNVINFLRLLYNAGKEINPHFRVLTRLESFYGEHDTVWEGLQDGIDVETASLVARGWTLPYSHPRYKDQYAINGGSIYQMDFATEEEEPLAELRKHQSNAHFYFAPGPHTMFQPLLGIPYPFLVYQRLKQLRSHRVDALALSGGTFPPQLVPYNVNYEVLREYQFNPELDPEKFILSLARKWTSRHAQDLVKAWKHTEEAILAFPIITSLYATFGFTWYRLWVRPLVPDIEAIPEQEREYYERFMCTTPHNPNNVDLSKDVLFTLTTPEKSREDVQRMDQNLWKPIDMAIELLTGITVKDKEADPVLVDQLVRLVALRCWFMTQRNVAAWIANVYGFMQADNKQEKELIRKAVMETITMEIENSRVLMKIIDSGVEFMTVTAGGETPLVHGSNLKQLLQIRISLMEKHREDAPYIDPDYMFRKAGQIQTTVLSG